MTYSLKHSAIPISRILAAGLFVASLSGCMVGPNYHTPAVPTPPAFKEPAPALAIAVPAGAAWWKVFNDATLDDLETQAIAANPDIQIAVAHVDRAVECVDDNRGRSPGREPVGCGRRGVGQRHVTAGQRQPHR